jgi:hypothetical protein
MNTLKSIAVRAGTVLSIVLTLLACTKEQEPSLIERLAENDWRKMQILISLDSISDTIPTVEVINDDCRKDNFWTFSAESNTFQLLEGPTKCSPSDPDIKDQGIIEELNNGTQLRVEGGGTQEIWEIESFSASSFRVSYFARTGANKLAKFRVRFDKI